MERDKAIAEDTIWGKWRGLIFPEAGGAFAEAYLRDSRSVCHCVNYDLQDITGKIFGLFLLEKSLQRKPNPCMISCGSMPDLYMLQKRCFRAVPKRTTEKAYCEMGGNTCETIAVLFETI